jgi:hypothetical protein
MIKAYHRVPSNKAFHEILKAGALLPAVYRAHPEAVVEACTQEMNKIVEASMTPARAGVTRILEERVDQIEAIQEQEGITPIPNPDSMLWCADLAGGDFQRVFLTPGVFVGDSAARGWPLTGFAFDAEELIQKGAEYRREDFLSDFRFALRKVLESDLSEEEAYAQASQNIDLVLDQALDGETALEAIQIYDDPSKDPREHPKYDWPSRSEVVWTGPLPLDLAVEFWLNGKAYSPADLDPAAVVRSI